MIRPAIDLVEFAARPNRGAKIGKLKSTTLERWLIEQRLAERDGHGRLRLTERGVRLGRGIE